MNRQVPSDLRFRQGSDWSVTITVTQGVRWSAGIDGMLAEAVRDAAREAGVNLAGEGRTEWVPLMRLSSGRVAPCDPRHAHMWHYVATFRTIDGRMEES